MYRLAELMVEHPLAVIGVTLCLCVLVATIGGTVAAVIEAIRGTDGGGDDEKDS